MYGAILGDIIGSRFEFDNGGWTKDFELLTYESKWTDDTFLRTGAITLAQYDKSYGDLVKKMGMESVAEEISETEK